MNITKRILSTLLAIAMMLGAFTTLFTVQVSAAEKETTTQKAETIPVKDYVTQVYNNPEEKKKNKRNYFLVAASVGIVLLGALIDAVRTKKIDIDFLKK